MLLVSEQLTHDGKPVVVALGVERTGGKLTCEIVYVSPERGVREDHTPIPESPISMLFIPAPGAEAKRFTVKWPGLTSGVANPKRLHENIILRITEEN